MITDTEKEVLKQIIGKYNNIYSKIHNLEQLIEQLGHEKDELINELESIRQEEKYELSRIIEKNGEISPNMLMEVLQNDYTDLH